ncbi:MAG: serpin family protein [Bacteroidales bacterium]|nr:serpin family protein [Bacteroidales bacterium]
MKHIALLISAAILMMVSVSCEKLDNEGTGEETGDNPPRYLELSTKSAELVQQGNNFAFEFVDRVNQSEKNDFIISPLSMQFLLGMLLDGAQGKTAEEICKVLGYGAGEVEAVNEYCQSMMTQLPNLDKKTKISLANAIFVNRPYTLLNTYKSTVSKYYQAEVSNLDFSKNASSLKTINGWCSKNTNGLIPKVLNSVDPTALAYLLNALYFKSEWSNPFPKANTAKEPFTLENGNVKKVPMMKNNITAYAQENDDCTVIQLLYGNGVYSMQVILPAQGKKLTDVTAAIKAKGWRNYFPALVSCDVDLWLPKFETKYEKDLNDILSDMGMPSAFSPAADFKAMSNSALCLSFVKQDAIIKVDEEGTEAAAVSMAGMVGMAFISGQHIVFHADRPFLYLITENSTGAILFAGKYSGK